MNSDKYKEMDKLEKFHWWFIYRQNVLKFILKKYLFNLDKNAKIVDIGCGTGGNVQLLSEKYTNVYGIDNNELAIKYCKEKLLKNIMKGELPDLSVIEDNSADLILLFDVLEHVEEDDSALAAIKNKLKPEGHLILTVPAFSFLWSKHDEVFHHKRRYNIKQIKKKLKVMDFKIIKASYLYFLLFPFVLTMRLLKQVVKSCANVDDFKLNNKFLNLFVRKILYIENFFLNYIDYPFGSSVLILAKK